MDLSKHWQLVEELIHLSAEVILNYWGRDDLEVMDKPDDTPVTLADREAEAVMRKRIREAFPGDGIIGEEYGNEREDAECVWVLDPIDGTISFKHGVPLFGTLIALKVAGQPVLGGINQPVLKKAVIGDGTKTLLNGRPVRCSEQSILSRALLLSSDHRNAERYHPMTRYTQLIQSVRTYRTWGDAFGYLAVATGAAEIMADPIVNEWDFVGHIPIIRGAGGTITDWYGKDPVGKNSVLASNSELHAQVLEKLHG